MRPYNNESTPSWATLARSGVIGGVAGGIVMAMFMMVVTAVSGMGFLRPLYLIAASLAGSGALTEPARRQFA